MNLDKIPQQFAALKQVLSQPQGSQAGALMNQQTPGSPSAQPNTIPQSVQPQGSPMPSAAHQTPQGTGLPTKDPEALIITKGLLQRQKTLGAVGQ
jgi:hypothetical protein